MNDKPEILNQARVKDCSGNPFCPVAEALEARVKRLQRKAWPPSADSGEAKGRTPNSSRSKFLIIWLRDVILTLRLSRIGSGKG